MTVLGLDLSLTATGICRLADGSPELTTVGSKGHTKDTIGLRAYRLRVLADLVLAAVAIDKPDLVIVEGPSVMSKGGSNWDRAGLWWHVVGALHAMELPTAIVPPSTLKKWAAGKGNADKATVAVHLARLWPDVTAADDNQWDALALATMGAQWLGRSTPTRAHHAASLAGGEWPERLTVAS